jgi:hypothetical protein
MVSSGSWSSVPTVSDLSLLTDNDSLTSVNFASQNVELQCTFSSITQDKIINRFNLTSCNIPQLFNTIKLYASNNLDDRGMPKLIINNQQFKSRETKTYSFHTLSNYQYYWITFISDEPIILSQVSFLSN